MIPCEEEIQIRDMARQFAQERLKPFAADWDREHRFPAEAIREMADLGFLGMLVPEEWGGAQTGHLAYAMALEEIAAGDGACSTIMSVHNSVGCMPIHKFGIAAQAVGMARAAFEAARDYAHERETFGKPIIEHQAVAFRLADMATRIAVARQMVHHAASLREAGLPCLTEASMAKLFASEMAEEVCSAAIQTLGGYGYLKDFPVERIYRDVRVCQIYEGTSDVQRLVIARSL